VDGINIAKNQQLALHEVLTDIANENNPNNLAVGSDIYQRITLLPVGKDRALNEMNSRLNSLFVSYGDEEQFEQEEKPPTRHEFDYYQQAVAKLQVAIEKAQQEVNNNIKNANLAQIEKAITHLKPFAETTENNEKLAWENNHEAKTI